MQTPFQTSIRQALHDPNLSGALGRFSEAYRINRAKAYDGIDFEALRERISGCKAAAAAHLDEMANRFAEKAEARAPKFSARTALKRPRHISCAWRRKTASKRW